ncbi:MAG: class I SAM-dependent methyltransferase [Candidatus Nanohaloarchaeota archaeon QJJ-5]|nr:class I SAM-dependent methyltransferase [Candidatus Nanohaloarchaeota archaeon QJJ-5]
MNDSIEAYDRWAEYYDLLYQHQDMDDTAFYVEQAATTDGPVLEIGCGTGRIYLELLENGVDADGIDISPNMLATLKEKADDRGLEPSVQQADMTEFDLDRSYDLIIIPFRTFLHNTTKEQQLATLNTCYDHLRAGGVLMLNFFQPDPDYISAEYGRPTMQRFVVDGEEFLLIDHSRYQDPVEGLVTMEKELISAQRGEIKTETLTIRLIDKPTFDLLLEQSQFTDWTVHGGFEKKELTAHDQELVWEITK